MEKEEQKEKTKTCKVCCKELPLSMFYKNKKATKDGHLNKCKACMAKHNHEKYMENMKNPEYVEKQRQRSRDKYKRLGYKNKKKQKNRDAHNALRCVKKHINIPMGCDVHHWNYNYIYDVFILNRFFHSRVHHIIVFDEESRCFLYNGELLDTKEKHEMALRKILGLKDEEEIIKFKKE